LKRPAAVRLVLLAALGVAGLALALGLERSSVERANRLHRAGAPAPAATTYREHVARDAANEDLRYNLGTSLLVLAAAAAEPELTRATLGSDDAIRANAHYNLGVWGLARALDARSPDSVRAHAARSVESNKEALRLEPGRPDARWNLAIATRMLDSIDGADGRPGTESVEGSAQSDRLVLSDDLRELDQATDPSNAPRRGADEAPADPNGAPPLSLLEADRILAASSADGPAILGKLLTFEGRLRRSSQPAGAALRW
jgi:hypothetical protein